MAMLKTFDLKGNKLSFADWISNLSPCETPFVSMVGKEKVDQTQYSWQTDRLAQPNMQGTIAAGAGAGSADPDKIDIAFVPAGGFKEGAAFASQNLHHTKVHTNFTQIFRKAVRVSDTTKKVSLYGRNSELGYQMEKAGMEIKRDLEHAILNSQEKGRLGTETKHGVFDGFQNLIAPFGAKCFDTGAIVNKAVVSTAAKAGEHTVLFTKAQVFDLTYNLYLAGSRANKIMFHPMHMSQFSDWIGNTAPKAGTTPHLHRMFDGLETKYNAVVKKIRDPLGQEYTLIPNRHMPVDKLFFFNESDWSQMVLREPTKTTLAKMGSSEKQMIEFEVGLRHRNPFASGILKFTVDKKHSVDIQLVNPQNLIAEADKSEVLVTAVVRQSDGTPGPAGSGTAVTFKAVDEDGATVHTSTAIASVTEQTDTGDFVKGTVYASHKMEVAKAHKGKRIKVTATVATPDPVSGQDVSVIDALAHRD